MLLPSSPDSSGDGVGSADDALLPETECSLDIAIQQLCNGTLASPCDCMSSQECQVYHYVCSNVCIHFWYLLLYTHTHTHTLTNTHIPTCIHTHFCYPLQCVSPYVGDGSLCVLDTDADGYPDFALSTCTDEDSAMYCSADTCRYAPNSDQTDISPCVGDLAGAVLEERGFFDNSCNFCTMCRLS